MEKLQELFTDRVNNTLGAIKKHFYDKFEVKQNLNRLDMLKQFVQFLVENDKIDRHNVRETNYGWEFNYYWTIPNSKRDKEIQVERLLMLLSIQDNPIEFLVSVLE